MYDFLRYIVAVALVAALVGCSLSDSVLSSAADYNSMADSYSDQVLVNSVLRARDYAPINMTNLSTITGSLSVQGSVQLTVPFGTIPQAGSRNQVQPMIQGTTSPTWNMAPLNTEGFTLGMLQPVSPTYLVSKWNTGVDKEFLLLLFVKSMRFADAGRTQYINDPDSPTDMAAFKTKLESIISSGLSIKEFNILEPLGPEYNPDDSSSLQTTTAPFASGVPATGGCATAAQPAPVSAPGQQPTATPACSVSSTLTDKVTDPQAAALMQGLNFATGLADTQFHVGNTGPKDRAGNYRHLQLYRQFPSQVALCAVATDLFGPRPPPAPTPKLSLELAAKSLLSAMKSKGGGPSAGGGPGGPSSGPTAGSTSSTSSAAKPSGSSAPGAGNGSAMTAMSAAMQADRISAIVPYETCQYDQLVLPATTEKEEQDEEKTFAHIEWRSISEIIQYLGSIVRNQGTNGYPTWTSSGTNTHNTLFTLQRDVVQGIITVSYRGHTYSVPDASGSSASSTRDHSAQALAMLNELIGVIRVSSDIPVTQQFQVIP